MEDAIFIYKKNNEYKVFDRYGASEQHKILTNNGWKHIQTISASIWIEKLLSLPCKDRNSLIVDLTNEP